MADNTKQKNRTRLTVTLGEGQRATLEAIASQNGTTLAFVVRYAIRKFIDEHLEERLELAFPSEELRHDDSNLE